MDRGADVVNEAGERQRGGAETSTELDIPLVYRDAAPRLCYLDGPLKAVRTGPDDDRIRHAAAGTGPTTRWRGAASRSGSRVCGSRGPRPRTRDSRRSSPRTAGRSPP